MSFVRLITILALMTIGATAAGEIPFLAARAASKVAASDLIDINHANAAQLRALPGIGEAYSVAIVKNRPCKNKTQLQTKGIIPAAAYRRIRDRIIAKQ